MELESPGKPLWEPPPIPPLDELFGPCVEAGAPINEQEKNLKPASLQKLNEESAVWLLHYTEMPAKGLLLVGTIHRSHPILWVMDAGGEIWLAIEEVVDEDGHFRYSLGATARMPDGHVKLGHPSLLMSVGDKRARMGGEIKFRPTTGRWIISNRSGRYGQRPHQTPEHLQAVADRFGDFGIKLEVSFWPSK